MIEEVNQTIRVVAVFKDGQAKPVKFLWQNREYLVRSINLTYTRFIGRDKIYFFAVSDLTNFFKLEFNSGNLVWRLLEIQAD